MDQFLPAFKECLQKEPPFCMSACPFHLDVVDFVDKMERGAMDGAYKTYRNAVGFPAIVSSLCPEYCKTVCPLDHTIELSALERACVSFAKKIEPPDYNLPPKNSKVAIVGLGVSGMGCLLRLATKKYQVTVYEKSSQPGGQLWDLMDSAIFLEDFRQQLIHETYTVHYNYEIKNIQELSEYDAVYVATGKEGCHFDLLTEPSSLIRHQSGDTAVFFGGSLLGQPVMHSLADGLQMGTEIDNFLKTGNLHPRKPDHQTSMVLDPRYLENQKPFTPVPEEGFDSKLAVIEANRCLRCQCDPCRTYCDLTTFYNKWPLRIRDEIQATTLPGTSEVKSTPAKRLISTCTQCGLCKETCPKDIDLGGLILAARKNMHKQGKLPWVFHEFWIRDMQISNGDQAFLCHNAPDGAETTLAFFPGCQLGASDPSLVIQTYELMLEHHPGTGIFVSCCGLPAQWGGDEDEVQKVLVQIRESWIALSKPTLVLACPSCMKFFAANLPEIPCTFLYELLAQWGIRELSKLKGQEFAVFDPCSTHPTDDVRQAVRSITEQAGISLGSMPRQEANAACCSYGGQGSIANPQFAQMVVNERVSQSPLPYIAYCINCRDAFLEAGKPTYHLLDLLFDRNPKLETISQRRQNRKDLRKQLLSEFWGEVFEMNSVNQLDSAKPFALEIDAMLQLKLSKSKILEEDMRAVISFCEETGRKVWNPEKNTFSGYCLIGHGTYWAEYQPTATGFRLVNGYGHRISVELEAVWNGNIVNADSKK
jgi:Fe-S oxidoreductase